MITPRLLLLYNFGLAILFAAIGLLSMLAFEPVINRAAIVPPFDSASRQAIHEEQDMERLRSRAAYYFELGRDLKRARYVDAGTLYADARRLCFVVSVAFILGGLFSLAVLNRRKTS